MSYQQKLKNYCIIDYKYLPKTNDNLPLIFKGDILYGADSESYIKIDSLKYSRKITKLHLEINYNLSHDELDQIPLMISNQPPPVFNIVVFKYLYSTFFPSEYYDFVPKNSSVNKFLPYYNSNLIYFTETLNQEDKTVFNIPGVFKLEPNETIYIMIFPSNNKDYLTPYTFNGFINVVYNSNFI